MNIANTALEMLPAVGQLVAVRCDLGAVTCKVLDVKNSYGRNRLLVVPVAGSGQVWVDISRVSKLESQLTLTK